MNFSEICTMSATELALMIRNKILTSVEVVEAYLDQIERVNPYINAVVQYNREHALQLAQKADEDLENGVIRGELHGVPVTIKDAIDTKDYITTYGVESRSAYMPKVDATVVARLRDAGAIILGKTNLPELCMTFESNNNIFGRTNNPYDLTKTPGGSSGGEAAIIAAGGSPLGIGSDASGSIRLPSHYCGIAGLKPTRGRVPETGHIPPGLGFSNEVGPLARYVKDLRTSLAIIEGTDSKDPTCTFIPSSVGQKTMESMKIAIYTNNQLYPPTPETVGVIEKAVNLLEEEGIDVEEYFPEMLNEFYSLNSVIKDHFNDTIPVMQEIYSNKDLSFDDVNLIDTWLDRLDIDKSNKYMSASELFLLNTKVDVLRSKLIQDLSQYDVIICPVCAGPAIPHGSSLDPTTEHSFNYTRPYNWLGFPSVVFRGGQSDDGLPIGVQVVAKHWREDIALLVAEFLEERMEGWQAPELFFQS
ncbi:MULTISPECIES: amidase [Bacillaceae]|uniref:Amidase n=1 Tax=Evansella alkalicola TaxID=745819 RepID=A0ABS6JS09_9BACI|nr:MULTISPECIES: amidase [Bacillaceae]MBU9721359.1 amidase [Bacillus alkalicola]